MPNLVRFDGFELDCDSHLLRKRGLPIRLPHQCFQVLACLLEHPGCAVTREDLRRRLWSDEVFVDFDNNLNILMARLREQLCDSAQHPRFIETLPRYGYRFIADVQRVQPVAEPASAKRTRLLVLPFINLSGDAAQEYFSDAVTDEIITAVAGVAPEHLAVIARTTAMHYKGSRKDVSAIGRELNLDYVVEGAVSRWNDQLTVNVQLIQTSDQTHLFAKKYDANMRDVFSLHTCIAQDITTHIPAALERLTDAMRDLEEVTLPVVRTAMTARSIDADVYDATTKGKATLEYATREGQVHQSIKLFQNAIDRDPMYAPAWAGLGEALWYLAAAGLECVAPGEVRDKAMAAAERALELDAGLPEAYKARAVIAIDAEWDLGRAQRLFDRVLELRPGYAVAHNLYGQLLTAPLLCFEEARRHLDHARELDPLSPWNDINLLAWWIHQGRPERALEEGERACRRNPTVWTIRGLIGHAKLLLGQAEQASPQFEMALKLLHPARPATLLAPLGLAYGLAARRVEALKVLAELERVSQNRYISPFYLSVVYSGLDRMNEAFHLLYRALEQRTPYLILCVPNDGNSVALRRSLRWKAFIERLRPLVRFPAGTSDPYS